jgi:riboflavin biosynthesis pyrimidine reductase
MNVWEHLTAAAPVFPAAGGGELPYVVANMVVSVDGKSSVDDRVGALTAPVDQEVLYALRAQADAVLVGSGTVIAEGYGELLPGDGPQPLLAIPTSQPQRLEGVPVLDDMRSDLALLTDAELPEAKRTLHRVSGPDLRAQLRALKAEHGVERIVCEGGPTLLGALQREGLLRQWFLALSPTIVADGEAIPVIRDPVAQDLELVACAHADDYVFLRYRLV